MTNLPTAATSAGCHGSGATSPGFLGRWRVLMIAGGVIAAGIAVALWQQWPTPGALAPLLIVLPCALMMLVCMRRMNHGQPSDPTPAPTDRPDRATADVRS